MGIRSLHLNRGGAKPAPGSVLEAGLLVLSRKQRPCQNFADSTVEPEVALFPTDAVVELGRRFAWRLNRDGIVELVGGIVQAIAVTSDCKIIGLCLRGLSRMLIPSLLLGGGGSGRCGS